MVQALKAFQNWIPACFLVPHLPFLLFLVWPDQQPAGIRFLDGSGPQSIQKLDSRLFSCPPPSLRPSAGIRFLDGSKHSKTGFPFVFLSPTSPLLLFLVWPDQQFRESAFWMVQAPKAQKLDSRLFSCPLPLPSSFSLCGNPWEFAFWMVQALKAFKNWIPACFLVPHLPFLLFLVWPDQQPAGIRFLGVSGHKSIPNLDSRLFSCPPPSLLLFLVWPDQQPAGIRFLDCLGPKSIQKLDSRLFSCPPPSLPPFPCVA